MTFLNPNLRLDFSAYIADRTHQFTGREWVFETVKRWLGDTEGERFFLLTGEPGSGKSAITAQLTQTQSATASSTFFMFSKLFLYHPTSPKLKVSYANSTV